jgi:hypothetical protein
VAFVTLTARDLHGALMWRDKQNIESNVLMQKHINQGKCTEERGREGRKKESEEEWKGKYNNLEAILKEGKMERGNGLWKQTRRRWESKEKKRYQEKYCEN